MPAPTCAGLVVQRAQRGAGRNERGGPGPAPFVLRAGRPAIRLMVVSSPFGFLLSSNPPSRRVGLLIAIAAVALCTLIIYPLKHIAPVVSLGVVYLPAVLLIAATWGALLGFATAVLSAAAFNFFHLPPVGQFTIQDSSNWVALVAFLVVGAARELGGGA